MDVEGLVKQKLKLQEQNKELKQGIKDTKFMLHYKDKEIEKLKEKLKEISLISGGRKITFIKSLKRWGR